MYCYENSFHGRNDLGSEWQAGLITPMRGAILKDAGVTAVAWVKVEPYIRYAPGKLRRKSDTAWTKQGTKGASDQFLRQKVKETGVSRQPFDAVVCVCVWTEAQSVGIDKRINHTVSRWKKPWR